MAEERRLVTVLFADVVGSTALGESMDPEDVRSLLGRLFEIAREVIEEHGGRLEKFIGDAIMAVFGLPTAHDDDAARALSAALDLRDRVQADPTLAERVPIRLGVNGGEVIATRDADAHQFLITGDPVNTAARLQQAGDPWTILVGDRTVRAAGDRFSFGPTLALEAKGKGAPVKARQLLGRQETPARRRGRLVGRQADLDQLALVSRRAFDERRPFLVSVVAPAGVGKTRLLEEFLDGLAPTTRVATAQCLPYGQRLTYWPMRSILLSIVELTEGAAPGEVRSALVTWLRERSEPDPERTAELLVATVGGSEVEGGDRGALFNAWRRFVELAAERAPLVLVIEDLHWSSDSLLDLVEAILQPRADVPLLMIALARPELLDRRPAWGGGWRSTISISLEPLPTAAVAELVADLLGGDDPRIVEAVVQRAEGNPFYAGEIVRSLVERLGPAPDSEAVSGAIAALPDTVHATVLARLDALEPSVRRAVQLGAVLGRTFEPAALPAVDPSISTEIADEAVAALIDRDLLRPSGATALTFRHILIREVAYGTLPRAERARLHAAAGAWVEHEAVAGQREDELAELVAFHLREAVTLGRLLGEQASPDLVTRTVAWLRRAAEAAAAGAASAEAARHLNAAIELAPRELLADLYERLGQVWVGGDQAAEAFEHAYQLVRELDLGPDRELRTLAQGLVVGTRWIGSIGFRLAPADREQRYGEVERLLGENVSEESRLHGLLALGFRPLTANRPTPDAVEAGQRHADAAVELAQRLGNVDLTSAGLDAATVTVFVRQQPRELLAYVERRLGLGDRLSTGERTDAEIVNAWMHALLGELPAAEQAAERARAGMTSGQASSWVLGATAWRVLVLFAQGRWDEALTDAARAERAWQESELAAPWYALNGLIAAHAVARARGDSIAADHWRELAYRIFERSGPETRTQHLQSYFTEDLDELAQRLIVNHLEWTGRYDYIFLAMALLADRRHPVPPEALDELLEYCAARDLLLVSSQARRLRGVLRGDRADLEAAIEELERIGARPFVARARAELGLLLGDREAVNAAVDALEALGDVEHAGRVAQQLRTGDGTGAAS